MKAILHRLTPYRKVVTRGEWKRKGVSYVREIVESVLLFGHEVWSDTSFEVKTEHVWNGRGWCHRVVIAGDCCIDCAHAIAQDCLPLPDEMKKEGKGNGH